MLTKGSNDYKKAQEIARKLEDYAKTDKRYHRTFFDCVIDSMGKFLYEIKTKGGFAAQVAESVSETIDPFALFPYRVSSKQAWIIACSAVENNIELK